MSSIILPGVLDHGLIASGTQSLASADVLERSRARARDIYNGLTVKQRAMVTDPNPWISACCSRRSGKSYMGSSTSLIVGEANPDSIVLLISLTLKTLKRNYWFGSRSGLPFLDRKYGLGMEFNSSELRWQHQNGSIGYLLGAEDRNALEYIRGIEADLYIIDECKSFPPAILEELITDILAPQRISRRARVMMIGTPGSIFAGPFWQATCKDAVHSEDDDPQKGQPYLVPYGEDDPWGRERKYLWSFHTWGMQDNEKMPHQWQEALDLKKLKGWSDDHPTWQREYLGRWIATAEGLVYRYSQFKHTTMPDGSPRVNWRPEFSDGNILGLPADKGPWHLVMGMDVGYEDPLAITVAAWSETCGELRHIHDVKMPHLLVDEAVSLLQEQIDRFGRPELIAVDTGGSMAKSFAETLIQRYGLPVVAAKKTEKFDYIELMNSDFAMGRIKIIPGSNLEEQLESVQFDLSKGAREELAHKGKLKEDPACPNDVTDAFLYMWRECHHHFSKAPGDTGPPVGSIEWWEEREKKAYSAACTQAQLDKKRSDEGRKHMLTRENLPFGLPPGFIYKG